MSVLFYDAFFDHVLEVFWSEKCAVLLNFPKSCSQNIPAIPFSLSILSPMVVDLRLNGTRLAGVSYLLY